MQPNTLTGRTRVLQLLNCHDDKGDSLDGSFCHHIIVAIQNNIMSK